MYTVFISRTVTDTYVNLTHSPLLTPFTPNIRNSATPHTSIITQHVVGDKHIYIYKTPNSLYHILFSKHNTDILSY